MLDKISYMLSLIKKFKMCSTFYLVFSLFTPNGGISI